MKKLSLLALMATIIIFFSCAEKKEQILEINGTVVNSDTKSILLMKPTEDMRFDSLIEIPVVDNKFYYTSKLQNTEFVNLIVGEAKGRGFYRPMPLFLENEKIDITIYSEEDFDKNIVAGGKYNAEYKKYMNDLDSKFKSQKQPLSDSISILFKNDEYNSDAAKALYLKLRASKSQDTNIVLYKKLDVLREQGLDKSDLAKKMTEKQDILVKKMKAFQNDYIKENPTLVSYSFFLKSLISNEKEVDLNLAKETHKRLSDAYPNHPYNDLAFNLLNAIENIKIGKKYLDFSAPELNGNEVKLSDKINGKFALLDLWATWCGPCIAKSRTMVPLYNEYKDIGFTVVGVAGEFKNTDRLVRFLEKEKWPWLQLVELDRKNAIWQKYGVDGGGGGIFLIDDNGKILAKDPTADEVRKVLESRLN